jgi:hypothetical protein
VDPPSRQRIGYELRAAVRSIWRAAESFGEAAVSRTLYSLIEGAASLDEKTLAAIDDAASILTASGDASMANRFDSLATPARAATPVTTPRIPTPPPPPAPAVSRAGVATSGAALHDLLGAGLQGLAGLDEEPMSAPRDVEDEAAVPIGELLYRGRAALRRAAVLGDAFKRSATPATPDALAELYDLLELAATE